LNSEAFESLNIEAFESLNKFSLHLFWDTQRENLDLEEHRNYIIRQVLEYGLIGDWQIIKAYYGIDRIAETVASFREMDPKTLAFVAAISHKPKDYFRCYTTQLSNPQHWNF